MFGEHWFWWLLTAACILWYSTLTLYIAIRGGFDIRRMLAALRKQESSEQDGSKD
jgi:hypothetical protein